MVFIAATVLLMMVIAWASTGPSTSALVKPKTPHPKQATQAAHTTGSILLEWVGDITPGSRYGIPPGNGRGQLNRVSAYLRNADLTLGNLEGTLSNGGPDKCGSSGGSNCFSFRAPTSGVDGLKSAGFDLLNLANNHAWDFGQEGQSQTTHALQKAGIRYSGKPGQITILRHGKFKVAAVGFAPYAWAANINAPGSAARLVQKATHMADLVVVMIHAGAEGSDKGHVPYGSEYAFGENRGDSRAFAHKMIRVGADLVVGSGPHVVRGMEWYHGHLIAYSAGNFAGWHNFGLGGNLSESALLRVRLDASGKMLRGQWRSVWIQQPGYPVLDQSNRSGNHANELGLADFGKSAVRVGPDGQLITP